MRKGKVRGDRSVYGVFVRVMGPASSMDVRGGRKSLPAADENEAAHGDAQLQEKVVKRER
jgi:hypothetical protein